MGVDQSARMRELGFGTGKGFVKGDILMNGMSTRLCQCDMCSKDLSQLCNGLDLSWLASSIADLGY
jgi:hypothetical protein